MVWLTNNRILSAVRTASGWIQEEVRTDVTPATGSIRAHVHALAFDLAPGGRGLLVFARRLVDSVTGVERESKLVAVERSAAGAWSAPVAIADVPLAVDGLVDATAVTLNDAGAAAVVLRRRRDLLANNVVEAALLPADRPSGRTWSALQELGGVDPSVSAVANTGLAVEMNSEGAAMALWHDSLRVRSAHRRVLRGQTNSQFSPAEVAHTMPVASSFKLLGLDVDEPARGRPGGAGRAAFAAWGTGGRGQEGTFEGAFTSAGLWSGAQRAFRDWFQVFVGFRSSGEAVAFAQTVMFARRRGGAWLAGGRASNQVGNFFGFGQAPNGDALLAWFNRDTSQVRALGLKWRSQRCDGREADIVGSSVGSSMVGTPAGDVIVAGGGADDVDALGGDDRVCLGSGNDRAFGRGGADRMFGDTGRDRLTGGTGDDRLYGGRQNDVLLGNSGRDSIFGGPGSDSCDAGFAIGGPFEQVDSCP